MLFPTIQFGLFFLLVFAGSWALRGRHAGHKWFLVAASYYFYACWDWRFTCLLAFSSIANYLGGRWLDATEQPKQRKLILALGLLTNGGVLGLFKYYGFFVTSALNGLAFVGWRPNVTLLEVVLPVGISFFTFQGISYFVDVYRKQVQASQSLADILLYISFFPQLVAGPIVRAATFLPQLQAPPDPASMDSGRALTLIMGGLVKKTVIANYIGTGWGIRSSSPQATMPVPTRCLPSTGGRSRSTATSAPTATSRSGWPSSSGTASPRTSTSRTVQARCVTTGVAGTSRYQPGCGTTCTAL